MSRHSLLAVLLVVLVGGPASGWLRPRRPVSQAPASRPDSHLFCKSNPDVVGACFTIHGRLTAANGTPDMRIWRVGTKRILGVHPAEDAIVPPVIDYYYGSDTRLYGDYLVCPLEHDRPGEMQTVCVEAVTNLVVERRPPDGPSVTFRAASPQVPVAPARPSLIRAPDPKQYLSIAASKGKIDWLNPSLGVREDGIQIVTPAVFSGRLIVARP